jgi:hypothetical protein
MVVEAAKGIEQNLSARLRVARLHPPQRHPFRVLGGNSVSHRPFLQLGPKPYQTSPHPMLEKRKSSRRGSPLQLRPGCGADAGEQSGAPAERSRVWVLPAPVGLERDRR